VHYVRDGSARELHHSEQKIAINTRRNLNETKRSKNNCARR